MSSPAQSRFLIAVGSTGSGKSTLLSKFCIDGKKPITSQSPKLVTQQVQQFLGPDGIILVDTVGTNMPGEGTAVALRMVEGKPVHFVLLLSNPRWQTELASLLDGIKWAAPTDNVSVYCAHGVHFHAENTSSSSSSSNDFTAEGASPPPSISHLQSVDNLLFKIVPKRQQPGPVPKVIHPPPAKLTLKAPKSKASAADREQQQRQQWFAAAGLTLQQQTNLYQLWTQLSWCYPKQTVMPNSAWFLIATQEEIQKDRVRGEKMLEMHLHAMYPGPNDAQTAINLANNESLKSVALKIQDVQQHIEKLYVHRNPNDQLENQKYGDYVEALFWRLLTGDKVQRKYVAAFLKAVTA